MTGLREHFTETAALAKHYDVTATVLWRARRRRLVTRVVAALVVVAVSASAAVALSEDRARTSVVAEIDSTGPATQGRLDWLPPRFTAPPVGRVPALPTDRGVGEGAIVYSRDWVYTLLTRDGSSYGIPGVPRGISPDGRWLAYTSDGELVFRSLTDTRTRRTADSEINGWSVDGALAVLSRHPADGTEPPVVTILDLEDGTARTVPVPDSEWWWRRGLSRDGQLILVTRLPFPPTHETPQTSGPLPMSTTAGPQPEATTEPPPAPARTLIGPPQDVGFGIGFVDPVDRQARSVAVQATEMGLHDPEQWSVGWMTPLLVRADTGGLLFQPMGIVPGGDGPAYVSGDLLDIDPGTGAVLRRYRLPPVTTLDGPGRRLIGSTTDGVLLGATDHGGGFNYSRLELLDPETGQRRVVQEIPPGVSFEMTRGGRI
jgi:hypothetical protein